MSNKNAYEIRLDILQMAHSDENMKFSEKLNIVREQGAKLDTKLVTEVLIESLFPKTADIIARAKELYVFVDEGK